MVKEKRIFWAGVSAGVVGGLIGNILTGYIFEFYNKPNWTNAFGTILFTLIFFVLLVWINRQINKNK